MIHEYKICTRCGKNKHKSEYNTRKDKGYEYLKSYCKICCRQDYHKNGKNLCQCGNNKTKRSKYCKSCGPTLNVKFYTLEDVLHYEKYGKQVKYQVIRSRARNVIKDIKACQKCGYNKHVEACHIKPIASFSLDTPIDVINDKNNLLALCPNCHWELDNTPS